jgi:long-chain acyl-CoA synthetase
MAVNVVPESGGFDPEETLSVVNWLGRTSMFLAPTMVRRLVSCPVQPRPGAIRTLVWGGAPMAVPDVRRALERFGPCLAQIYGQGETPMTISVLSKDDLANREHPRWEARLASAGIANSAVELRIADHDGHIRPAGEMGEVQVRGETVMSGYWRNDEATRRALADGWLRTGDLGSLDREGYLFLMDREKDVILSGGSNIYPREVEEVLAGHPGVQEVAVIGRPDEEWGEVVVAYIVGNCSPAELDHLCLSRIARFKRPRDYVRIDALPKNSTGKILRQELRALDSKSGPTEA